MQLKAIERGDIVFHPYYRFAYKRTPGGEYNILDPQAEVACPNQDEYVSACGGSRNFDIAYFNITKTCNLRCTYCYATLSKEFVGEAESERILDRLEQLGVRDLVLIGGEPLCHRHFPNILQSALSRNFDCVTIATNGTQLASKHLPLLADQRVRVNVSLDGSTEEENSPTRGPRSFGKAMRGIELLKANGIDLRVMMVLKHGDVDRAKRFYDNFRAQGIDSGCFRIKQVDSTLKPTWDELLQVVRHVQRTEGITLADALSRVNCVGNLLLGTEGFPVEHCGAGLNSITIEPNGDVYPCVKRVYPSERMANLLDDDFVVSLRRSRDHLVETDLVCSMSDCQQCEIKFFCGGGCRAENTAEGVCRQNCTYYFGAVQEYANELSDRSV